jgi:hypothetical protein
MQCYKHREESAIAICSNCGKATCPDCCEDTGHGVACSSACEGELLDADNLKKRQAQAYGLGPKPPIPASVSTYFFFGVIATVAWNVEFPGASYRCRFRHQVQEFCTELLAQPHRHRSRSAASSHGGCYINNRAQAPALPFSPHPGDCCSRAEF